MLQEIAEKNHQLDYEIQISLGHFYDSVSLLTHYYSDGFQTSIWHCTNCLQESY
jgi:hypothetical protein